MFSLRTLIIFVIYAAVLYFGRRIELSLSRRNSPRPGLILPVVAVIVAAVLSFRNFWIAWDVQFSLFAFLAAVALFVFYAVPAIYFILLYTEGRKEVRARKVARSVRVRQTKTQQRVQSNLQQRYESPLQKQDSGGIAPVLLPSPELHPPRHTPSADGKHQPLLAQPRPVEPQQAPALILLRWRFSRWQALPASIR